MPTEKDTQPRSLWNGGVSELAIMLPIKSGRVPGERRTYEERAREVVSRLTGMADQGLMTPFHKIPSLHFGRVMIIRPEHYLRFSKIESKLRTAVSDPQRPEVDPYRTAVDRKEDLELRSWMYALVIFDGDPIAYLREITEYIEDQFDRLFENCEHYPYAKNFDAFWAWVQQYQIKTDLLFSPYSDLSVVRIKHLEAFRRDFDEFVKKVRSPDGRSIEPIDDLFDEFLQKTQQYAAGFPGPSGVYRDDE